MLEKGGKKEKKKETVFQISPYKSSGRDGLGPSFFNIIGKLSVNKLCAFLKAFF